MNIIADNGLYEVEYENEHYEQLEFVRIDHICEISYVTFKNILTGEVYIHLTWTELKESGK